MDLIEHIVKQRKFSIKTFGYGMRTKGITNHIRKELKEIEDNPEDLEEWIDVVILALDGAWRVGYSPEEIVKVLQQKLIKNKNRKWPDYKQFLEDQEIEHIR